MNFHHPDSKLVNSEDAVKFKKFMTSDEVDFKRTMPGRPMYYDRNFDFMKDRSFWLRVILLFTFACWASQRIWIERDRWRRWNRLEKLEEMPAHHFFNRGGVLVKKQFVGFEKIHQNRADVEAWYRKAYPALFNEGQ